VLQSVNQNTGARNVDKKHHTSTYNTNYGKYAGISGNKPNTKTSAIYAATGMSPQKTTVAPNSNGDGKIQNIPLKGSSIKRLSCQKGQILENKLMADGDRMPPEMKLLTTTMANLDSKLDHLLKLFSNKERQLEKQRKENSELKLENKRLDETNRQLEKQLNISSDKYCKHLAEKHTSATDLVKEILQQYERKEADRQQ
jgi:hypothetical protein